MTAPITASTLLRVNASASSRPPPDDEQQRRQGGDQHADDERPQARARAGADAEAVTIGEHRAADPDDQPDERGNDLIGGTARGRALLLQFVGDLGLDLGEDVVRARACGSLRLRPRCAG